MQDPNEDRGLLTISNDGQVLFTYQLIDILSYDQQEFTTPIVVEPGTSLTVTMQCVIAGDASTGVCNPAVFFSGRVTTP